MKCDFYDLLLLLVNAKVEFVIVGGFAAAVHGCELITQDIDICCDFQPDNLLRLQSAIADLNPVHRMTVNRLPLELTAETAINFSNLYLDTDAGQLDCISDVKGVGNFEQVKQKSETIKIQGQDLRVLDADTLIESKKAMGRPRDREAVKHLELIRKMRTQRQ